MYYNFFYLQFIDMCNGNEESNLDFIMDVILNDVSCFMYILRGFFIIQGSYMCIRYCEYYKMYRLY